MSKFTLGIVGLVFSATFGFAQDMPLFTFAKLGAKWEAQEYKFDTGVTPRPAGLGDKAKCSVVTQDGATMYVGYADRAAVWAYPVKRDGKPDLAAGAPYAQLRIVEGYNNNRDAAEKRLKAPPTLAVTALLIDPTGRLYAGTLKDIQVFDPTGRLCGTLPLPVAGEVHQMGWQTAPTPVLALTIGGKVWKREMK